MVVVLVWKEGKREGVSWEFWCEGNEGEKELSEGYPDVERGR